MPTRNRLIILWSGNKTCYGLAQDRLCKNDYSGISLLNHDQMILRSEETETREGDLLFKRSIFHIGTSILFRGEEIMTKEGTFSLFRKHENIK